MTVRDEYGDGLLSRIREQIKAEPVYFAFMSLVLLYLMHSWYVTYSFSRSDSAQFPRIVIGFSIGIILLDVALKLYPGLTFGAKESDEELRITQEFEMDPTGVFIAVLWALGYAAGIYFIGFFTTTLMFVFTYILVNSDGEGLRRRAIAGAAWSVGITGFAWILFVEFLKVSSVFRLGFLP